MTLDLLPPYGKIMVYIACPYTKGDLGANVHRANAEWDALFDLGLTPVNPLWTHYQHLHRPRPYQDWMDYDEEVVRRCDAMLRLSGESSGADREVNQFRSLGKPVFFSREALAAWAFQKPLWTRPVLRGYRPATLAICGWGKHGKGTAARWLSSHVGYKYRQSTSEAAAQTVFSILGPKCGYQSPEACRADRDNHRLEWAQIIADYNADDSARLYVEMADAGNDIIEGIRLRDEFIACRKEGLFECALWIDAGLRVSGRDESCEVEQSDCDVTIDNNGDARHLETQLRMWCKDVGIKLDERDGTGGADGNFSW